MKDIFHITVISILLFACTAIEKTDKENPNKIKSNFTAMIDEKLKVLQEEENKRKDAQCKLFEFARSKKDEYSSNYWVLTGYKYKIIKTKSIVSPYVADVQYKGIMHYKTGKTLQDCLNKDWQSNRKKKLFLLQKYAYQDGTWVLKEQKN
jgi:hypothetical protein